MSPTLAELIRLGRIRKGWNQAELADQAGIARTTVVQLERGTIQEPQARTLSKLQDVLELPPEALVRPMAKPAPIELLSEQAAFDWGTNPAVAAAQVEAPERFAQLQPEELDTLVSQVGVGGAMTAAGVAQTLDRMEADRETVLQLQLILQTHLRDAARQVIDGLYRSVAVTSAAVVPPGTLKANRLNEPGSTAE